MSSHNINKYIKTLLKDIFFVVGSNTPYKLADFLRVLLDAAEHQDFVNNTCNRLLGPTGETVFARLQEANFEKIFLAFALFLDKTFFLMKPKLRNRKVKLGFDITEEPVYGNISGIWMHPNKPVRGSTGCFKFLTVSIVGQQERLILGSLPVRRGDDIPKLVTKLLDLAEQHIVTDELLFDRGFDSYYLVDVLKQRRKKYLLLWRKQKFQKEILAEMKFGEIKEVSIERKYKMNFSSHKVMIRYVFIKRKHKDDFDWVFVTNTKKKSLIPIYKKRWGIETIFRVLDNVQIKTTTKNEIIRYFLNIFCCTLYNLWKIEVISDIKISLKNFVCKFVAEIERISLREGIT